MGGEREAAAGSAALRFEVAEPPKRGAQTLRRGGSSVSSTYSGRQYVPQHIPRIRCSGLVGSDLRTLDPAKRRSISLIAAVTPPIVVGRSQAMINGLAFRGSYSKLE